MWSLTAATNRADTERVSRSCSMSFLRQIKHSLVLTTVRGVLVTVLAGYSSTVQALPTCPDCSRIPVAVIASCSQQMVCGTDQNTYASACLALCQGVAIEHTEFCPGVTGSTDNSDEAIRESATTERIIHFLEEELHKFEGFQLLGKAEQKTQSTRDSVTSRPQQGSTQLSSRKCSIVRLDRHGNKYIGACTPADMHTVHSSKEHHGSAPTVRSDKSSLGSSSVKEESFFPEESSSFSQDRSENSTSSHHTSSDTPQLHTPLKHTTSQHARPNLISRVKDLFHLSGGSQTSTHSQTNSHTPAQKKGLRGLSAIIGEDNRSTVSSIEYPYTTIGQLRYNEAGSGAGFLCTGTLFSDRHVLTNAHCIYDRESGQFHSGWQFVPGLDSGSEPFGNVNYEFYDIYTDGYTTDFKNWDLAIVTLAEPIGLRTGWMGVKSLPPAGACASSPLVLRDLHTVGYPVEASASNTAYQDVCDLNVRNGCMHEASSHTCDTKVGNSGSPLFQADSEDRSKWLIRAVHFAGLKDYAYNLAIPIDDTIFQWIDCYRAGNTACLANDLMLTMSQ